MFTSAAQVSALGVDLRVEEHLEGPVGVVTAGVDVGAGGEESERVVEVGASVGVVTEVGVDTAGYLFEPHLVAIVRAGATFKKGKLVERPDESGGDAHAA